MFELDQAIAEWRQRLAAAGLTSSEVLDELESHLREDVEQQMRSGVDAAQAFERAVEHLGQAAELKSEFFKNGETKGDTMIHHN